MDANNIVAIDGPAGSGKSSVGRAVAQYLGYGFLPTGNYYRAFALIFDESRDIHEQLSDFLLSVRNDLDPYSSEFRVAAVTYTQPTHAAASTPQTFGAPTSHLTQLHPRNLIQHHPLTTPTQSTSTNTRPRTRRIRPSAPDTETRNLAPHLNAAEVTSKTAIIAQNQAVRARLSDYFRQLCAESIYPAVVIEGRDATTAIAPDAQVKIFLTASLEARANRRGIQLSVSAESTLETLRTRDAADNAITGFLSNGDTSRVVVDTSDLDFSQSVSRALEVIEAAGMPFVAHEWIEQNATTLAASGNLGPTVVIVGRPNVGKSALVNCILGRREAVVDNYPGVTRDRVVYPAFWGDSPLTLVDTGGWEPDPQGLDAEVVIQAEIGIDIADVIIFVVDVKHGPIGTDAMVARNLQKQKKPIFLVANKADDANSDSDAAAFWALGLGQPHPCSAAHGRGVADLMDKVMQAAPARPPRFCASAPRIALIGRPNVGKSSLINRVTNSNRAIVDNLAGTTRDPLDALATIDNQPWLFIDTAGLRRKFKSQKGADFYSYLRSTTVIQRSEVALLLIDASQEISEQDIRIAEMVVDAGRGLVIAVNKWDLLDDDRRYWLEREIEESFLRFNWAPRVNISAATGRGIKQLTGALQTALTSWKTRLNTAHVNYLVQDMTRKHPHPIRGGKQPRILFASQTGTAPPTFTLFTTGFLEPQYRRFVKKSIRAANPFTGSPIVLNMRVRTKRHR